MRSKEALPIGAGVRARKDCKTLRIKKIYFDAIKRGDKTAEYRSNTEYYRSLFKVKPHYLYLHYQGPVGLLVQVKSIRLVKTPARFKGSKMLPTPRVFKINLGRSRVVTNA